MRRVLNVLVLAIALDLVACVTTTGTLGPQPVSGQPDTFRVRVFVNAIPLEETFADRAANEEIDKLRTAKGYASSTILSREYVERAYVYTVKFAR